MADPKWTVAIHEAGHATVAIVLGHGVLRIIIKAAAPETEDGGTCVLLSVAPTPLEHAAYCWAGAAAEMIGLPQHDGSGHPPAWDSDMACFEQTTAGDADLATAAKALARDTLEANWPLVLELAEALMKNSTLEATDIHSILRRFPSAAASDEA